MGEWPPVYGRRDPDSSREAAERIEPKRGSRRAQVLDRLREARGAWVSGAALTTDLCGGSEGLRRVRELRQLGWNVERRPDRGKGRTGWQYRLAPDPPEEPAAPVRKDPPPDGPLTLFGGPS